MLAVEPEGCRRGTVLAADAAGNGMPLMRALWLADLELALPHLLDTKAAVLKRTDAGKLYQRRLKEKREQLEALPAAATERRPLAEQLAATDALHDGYGAAVWHYTEAMLRAPGLDAKVRSAAERIRAAFIPELAMLRLSYASEAANTQDRRKELAAHKADLALFPLPGKKQTLAAWVEGFLGQGDKLLELLQQRADQVAAQDGKSRGLAGKLRVETIGLLYRFRTALADDLAENPEQLRATDAELFAFVDQLATAREAALVGDGASGSDDEDEPTTDDPVLAEAAATSGGEPDQA